MNSKLSDPFLPKTMPSLSIVRWIRQSECLAGPIVRLATGEFPAGIWIGDIPDVVARVLASGDWTGRVAAWASAAMQRKADRQALQMNAAAGAIAATQHKEDLLQQVRARRRVHKLVAWKGKRTSLTVQTDDGARMVKGSVCGWVAIYKGVKNAWSVVLVDSGLLFLDALPRAAAIMAARVMLTMWRACPTSSQLKAFAIEVDKIMRKVLTKMAMTKDVIATRRYLFELFCSSYDV